MELKRNDKILITGGTGFVGRHLGKRLKQMGYPVVLTGRNHSQCLSASQFASCEALPMDVSHIESVRDIVAQVRPTVILHAAATKYVDLSESQPMDAIDINVVGSQNVARVAIEKGVRRVIGISTDKAAPPVRNTYGLTKALMERMFCSMDGKSGTRFLCVRFGNVAWSTGSVLCVWRQMLKDKGRIETCGPEMFRFFFTVDEAVDLVVTALEHADELQGKILTCSMKAVKMRDILRVWQAQETIEVMEIEERPGERLEEFLIGELELPYTRQWKYNEAFYYVISPNKKVECPLPEALSTSNAKRLSEAEIKTLLKISPQEVSVP